MLTDKNKRIALMIIIVIAASLPGIYAILDRLWSREIAGNDFYFEYMDFEGFCCDSWLTYSEQTEILTLGDLDQTMITVTKTDYAPSLLLDISYTSTAAGATVSATGRYVTLFWADSTQTIDRTEPTFAISTDGTSFSIDTSRMLWEHPFGAIGGGLEITFAVDTAGITETQDGMHTYTITIGVSKPEP